MCEVECNYKGKCTSYPQKCGSCKHNTGKRDYYEPDFGPYWRRYYPWYPWGEPYVWYTSTSGTYTQDNSAKDYFISR